MMNGLQITIQETLWAELVRQLKSRGHGKRESGAFLLGHNDTNHITHFICYDDLDPNALNSGIIEFDGDGFTPLWEFCLKNKLKVYADIHTHPSDWTNQSSADMAHPMIRQKDHLALIMPNYATNENQDLNGVGVFRYLGDKKWDTITGQDYFSILKTQKDGFFRKHFKQIVNWFN